MSPTPLTALLATQSDERLLTLARGGNERAFETIVRRYRAPLLRYVRRFLPDGLADDALQQASINAWSALGRGAAVTDLKPWLYRIARNASLDLLRSGKYDLDELSESLTASGGTEEDVERRAVMRETLASVAALPPAQREALLRTAVEGDARADIARDLGVTEGAVRQLVHRARTSVRAAATAVTPLPLVTWMCGAGAPSAEVTTHIAEAAAGAGTAGAGAIVVKSAAVVVAAAALATGSVRLAEHQGSAGPATAHGAAPREPAARALTAPAPGAARLEPVAAAPTLTTTGPAAQGSGGSGSGHGSSGSGRSGDGSSGHGSGSGSGDSGHQGSDDGSRKGSSGDDGGSSGDGGSGEDKTTSTSGEGKDTSGDGTSSSGEDKPSSGSGISTSGEDKPSSGSGISTSGGGTSTSGKDGGSGEGSSSGSGSGKTSGTTTTSGGGDDGSSSGDDGSDD